MSKLGTQVTNPHKINSIRGEGLQLELYTYGFMKTCEVEDQFRSMTSAGKFKSKSPPRQSSFLTRFWEEHPLSSELLEPEGRSCSEVPPTALQCVSTSFIRYATPKLSSKLNPIIRHESRNYKIETPKFYAVNSKLKPYKIHPFQTNVTTKFRQFESRKIQILDAFLTYKPVILYAH